MSSNVRTKYGVDAFMLPGYDVPGIFPAEVAQETEVNKSSEGYKIPPVIWMFLFLIVGYVGLRLIMEDV